MESLGSIGNIDLTPPISKLLDRLNRLYEQSDIQAVMNKGFLFNIRASYMDQNKEDIKKRGWTYRGLTPEEQRRYGIESGQYVMLWREKEEVMK